jgi:glycosyltransferase involved in cell wall biosynthesis
MKISATVITFNEEQHIKKCLDSLCEVADEIVVVDSFSTDGTEAICKSYEKVKFIKHAFEGYIEQKHFDMEQASHNWILALDGDECLSDQLIREINKLKQEGLNGYQAFSMPRLNNYCGRWIYHGGWYPDRKVRLWNKQVGKWGGKNPHYTVTLEKNTKTKMLDGDILHYTIPSLEAHVNQSNKFSGIAAEEMVKSGKKQAANFKMIFDPPFVFFKKYLLQLGFLDGFYGLTIAVVSAHSKFLKYAKYKQLRSQHEDTSSKF